MGKKIFFSQKYTGEPALLEYSETVNVYSIIRSFGENIASLSIPEQSALLRTLALPEKKPEVFGRASEIYAEILLRIIREKNFHDGAAL